MSLCHPFHRIAQIVAEASKEDPERVAWSENLLVRDRTSVTAEEVADTWIAVTFDYAVARTAGARAGIQTEMPDVPSARKPRAARFLDHAEADLVEKVRQAQLRGDPDAGTQWLKLLATLPKPSQAAIVNSAAKQIHWHLLPSALALRSDRVVALSLSDTVAPRWHSPPEDPEEQTKLMWLFSHEGIRPGHAAVTVLESDEYARGRAEVSAGGAEWRSRLSSAARWLELPGDDHGGVAVVQNRGELLETLYETAFAGYVEPVVAAYAERLAEHGIRVDSKRFYASGIVALVHPARHQYDLATVALREVGARVDQARAAGGVPAELGQDWEKKRVAAKLAAREADRHTREVTDFFESKPEYAGAVQLVATYAEDEPEATAPALLKAPAGCCLKSAGNAATVCNNCYRMETKGSLPRLEALIRDRGQRLGPKQTRRPPRA